MEMVMRHKTRMWQVYGFREYMVTIIQQWRDPYGLPMVRFAAGVDSETLAGGMSEGRFLEEATFIAETGPEIVEGAR